MQRKTEIDFSGIYKAAQAFRNLGKALNDLPDELKQSLRRVDSIRDHEKRARHS